jgi:hypothetical protein
MDKWRLADKKPLQPGFQPVISDIIGYEGSHGHAVVKNKKEVIRRVSRGLLFSPEVPVGAKGS